MPQGRWPWSHIGDACKARTSCGSAAISRRIGYFPLATVPCDAIVQSNQGDADSFVLHVTLAHRRGGVHWTGPVITAVDPDARIRPDRGCRDEVDLSGRADLPERQARHSGMACGSIAIPRTDSPPEYLRPLGWRRMLRFSIISDRGPIATCGRGLSCGSRSPTLDARRPVRPLCGAVAACAMLMDPRGREDRIWPPSRHFSDARVAATAPTPALHVAASQHRSIADRGAGRRSF